MKVAIINNGTLGMVRQWQELFYNKRYAATMLGNAPDFVKLAEAFGIKGYSAKTPAEMEEVIREGLAHEGPAVMDFKVRTEELVFPMVPAGKAIHEMILNPKKP